VLSRSTAAPRSVEDGGLDSGGHIARLPVHAGEPYQIAVFVSWTHGMHHVIYYRPLVIRDVRMNSLLRRRSRASLKIPSMVAALLLPGRRLRGKVDARSCAGLDSAVIIMSPLYLVSVAPRGGGKIVRAAKENPSIQTCRRSGRRRVTLFY
jgi:hypothetical protein